MGRGSDYHGSFQHPRRAFLAGVALVGLLLAGWVIGVEAGSSPSGESTRVLVRTVPVKRVVTVSQPVVRTVVHNKRDVVRLPGEARVVVIHENGHQVLGYINPSDNPLTANAKPLPVTVYVPEPTTVTETQTETSTVTVTVTVTDTGGSSSSQSSTEPTP
jgi:hypothetical protein